MKRWIFSLSITKADPILTEIDETLKKAGVEDTSTTGVQILADRFRKADAYARSAERRIYELQQSINEYERVFMAMKAAAAEVELPPVDEQRTPIEIAARRSSGVDLPQTQKTPVYVDPQADRMFHPGIVEAIDDFPRPMAVVSEMTRGRIAPTQAEKDKEA